jgi:hypothetical protein
MLHTAAWAYLMPLTTSRAFRFGILGALLILLMAAGAFMTGFINDNISRTLLKALSRFVVLPGLPIAAVLLGEMPLRDGIRHRTLLYPLLGPVPRPYLAIVRTLLTATILFVAAAVVVTVLHFAGGNYTSLPRTLAGVFLASYMYVPLFGLGHLITNRGLVLGVLFFLLFDYPLGRVPFAIKQRAPSHHMRVVSEQFSDFDLVVQLGSTESSVAVSVAVLVVLAAVLTALVAFIFRSRNLGELC